MGNDKTQVLAIDDCWNRIGVWSGIEQRCPELERVVHCYNCPVYAGAGRRLLDRPLPENYLAEWGQTLAGAQDRTRKGHNAGVAFRLGSEWASLCVSVFREVTTMRPIHNLPHNHKRFIRGLVSIRGELHICLSLGGLLGISKSEPRKDGEQRKSHQRLIVIARQEHCFVFPVSEVAGIHRYADEELKPVPSTLSEDAARYFTGVLKWNDCELACMNTDRLFEALQKKLA